MKYIFLVCFLLLAILALNILGVWYITDSAARIDAYIPPLETAIAGGDWQQAAGRFSQLEQQWRYHQPKWMALLNHEDTQAVELSFTDLQVLLKQEDRPRAEQKLAELRFYLQNLSDSERLTLGNLL